MQLLSVVLSLTFADMQAGASRYSHSKHWPSGRRQIIFTWSFLIPLPMLHKIIPHLGCKGKRKLLLLAPTELPNRCILKHVSYIQDEQDFSFVTSWYQAIWSKFPGLKEDLSEVFTWFGMASLGWHVLTVPEQQNQVIPSRAQRDWKMSAASYWCS